MKRWIIFALASFCLSTAWPAAATETEHLGIQVLPAPGPVAVDGKIGDWDLTGGLFACGDVENQRDQYGVWIHAMYDAQNLYILARFRDPTPLNNPGQTSGDYGFQGDSLQFRIITHADTPRERGEHFTCWRGRDGKDIITSEHGRKLDGGKTQDVKPLGAKQAFAIDADRQGYVQEIALPWKLLTRDGAPLKAGDSFVMTVEPNFTVGGTGRLSVKDIFRPGVSIDRVFTFMAPQVWGKATLEARGHIVPRPVRLSDGRELPVRMAGGLPVVDWTALAQTRQRPGFKTVEFTTPEDGYVSLLLRASDGKVVRQLLNCEPFPKGIHQVKWDGLTTPIWRRLGDPVPAGTYNWEAIHHKGIGLRLRGFACNGGATPWDYPPGTGNWGGDHGVPVTAAAAGARIYLGWSGAEAGKALLACDLQGAVQWNNAHGGIGGAQMVAVDGDTVYVVRETEPQGDKKVVLYRLVAATGAYSTWDGSESTDLSIASPDGLAAQGGKIFLSYGKKNQVLVLNGRSGREQKTFAVDSPGTLRAADSGTLLVVSGGRAVLSLDLAQGKSRTLIRGLASAAGLAVGADGKVFVAEREPDNQVKVFDREGRPLSTIGRKGGRPAIGPWVADGMSHLAGIDVDREGHLWVMEADYHPKRVSVWDSSSGKLLREFFGATHYGASGGAINPVDPNFMVGVGCEWRLDPRTGRGSCTGVVERRTAGAARFCTVHDKLYLVTGPEMFQAGSVNIYERLGEGNYKLRASIESQGKDREARTLFWADENGDGRQQSDEVVSIPGRLELMGYIAMDMGVGADLALYGSLSTAGPVHIAVSGFSSCGAPRYDTAHLRKLPAPGIPSADGKLLLAGNGGGAHYDRFTCLALPAGDVRWWYPNTFAGVHGSHLAPPLEVGLIRGCLGVVGTARLPEPVGNIWAISTNVGEWHLLSERGYYLTRLFQGDPVRVKFPPQAVPGAVMDDAPPGQGGEDFGGSMTQARDGRVYVQAGKTALWNLEVVGLDSVRSIGGGRLTISEAETRQALALRDQQASEGRRPARDDDQAADSHLHRQPGRRFQGCAKDDLPEEGRHGGAFGSRLG